MYLAKIQYKTQEIMTNSATLLALFNKQDTLILFSYKTTPRQNGILKLAVDFTYNVIRPINRTKLIITYHVIPADQTCKGSRRRCASMEGSLGTQFCNIWTRGSSPGPPLFRAYRASRQLWLYHTWGSRTLPSVKFSRQRGKLKLEQSTGAAPAISYMKQYST